MKNKSDWLAGAYGLIASGATLLAGAQGAPAAGPPGGGAGGPPAMAAAQDNALEADGKATIQGWGKLIDAGKVDEAFEKYVSKRFNDHSHLAQRFAGVPKVGYAEALKLFKQFAARPGTLVEQITANDAMVTIKGKLGQDIFRVEKGKITDHWDTLGGFTGGGGGAPGAGAGGPPGGGAGGPPGGAPAQTR
ncbi:MAG: hypothetical protein QM718_14310 [Steroidobacteraceae bacterium]